MKNTAARVFFHFLFPFFVAWGFAHGYASIGHAGGRVPAFGPQETERPDIEWFRKELGISSKYTEHESGPVGLSWAHFLTMVFLILSFMAAVIAAFLRYRRTKELLTLIMKEGSQLAADGSEVRLKA